ncbi:hypothetical protein NG796_16255 [Laspinema sp. A4]|uniref:hypothetical protein n=1 Tax=Laspinema sp. D2d TaxID=2953686 RepID=UPI0021BB9835|nr:hypothetical protein [Laspinema sp. D2d]MCT7984823.1 hypothetical protein [Laspinema sp. D2d]
MAITLSKEQLIHEIAGIDRRQKGTVFSSEVIGKILGHPQPWRTLKKDELIQVLEAWNHLLESCPKTADWKRIERGDRQVSLLADGHPWVDYFGFPSLKSAELFLEEVLPHCDWAIIRKSGKRVNASFECKVWGLIPDSLQAIGPQRLEVCTR